MRAALRLQVNDPQDREIQWQDLQVQPEDPLSAHHCYGMLSEGLRCRERSHIKAEQLEELVWSQVKETIQNPELIVAGIEALDTQGEDGLGKRIARAERDLQKVQIEEERAIRLYVSGKIKEDQLDQQRKFILERLETAREKLDDLRARESMASEKRVLMENLVQWAGKFGKGLDDLPDEKRRDVLRLLVDQVLVDRNNNISITLGIPTEDFVSIENEESRYLRRLLADCIQATIGLRICLRRQRAS